MKKELLGYAIFSIPTREARLFAGQKTERVSNIYPSNDNELQELLRTFQIGGFMNELISSYKIKAVY